MSERKLWLLRPVGYKPLKDGNDYKGTPWDMFWECSFGYVISAETEAQARVIAMSSGELGFETSEGVDTWLDQQYTTCAELKAEDHEGLVIQDFNAG